MNIDVIDKVQEMRSSRNTANSIFVKFIEDKDKFPYYAFCFFEGEDAKYYNLRISKYFKNNFLSYVVGNKKEVIKLFEKLDEPLYNQVIKMYFVDKDYDKSLVGVSDDLYETPCYSIENLYAQDEVFKSILASEFNINQAHSDYKKVTSDFESTFSKFMAEIIEFNALVLLRRKKSNSNSNIRFGDIKTSALFDIKVGNVVKSKLYDEIIQSLKDKLPYKKDELDECINELTAEVKPQMRLRGKNQLDFFCTYVMEIKKLNESSGYFTVKNNNVKINITKNRLSELSQYALTPEGLDEFIRSHYNKLITINKRQLNNAM